MSCPFSPGSPFAASLRTNDWLVCPIWPAPSTEMRYQPLHQPLRKGVNEFSHPYAISVASILIPDKFRSEWLSSFDDVAVIRIVEGLADLLFCFNMRVVRVHRVAKWLLVNLSKPFQKTRGILLLDTSFRQHVVSCHIRRFLVSQRDNPQIFNNYSHDLQVLHFTVERGPEKIAQGWN